MDDAAVARIEAQRRELESNIAKLRQALRHWQILDIDYEGLKEEFLGLPDDASAEECRKAATDFQPELVDAKEIDDLLQSGPRRRRAPQLVELLSKRVEYVSRNIETVRKQLADLDRKRNALLLAEEPDHRDDAGLPLAEITEELDDAGRVISSKVDTPGSSAPQLIDALKMAGIKDLTAAHGTITQTQSTADNHEHPPQHPPPSRSSATAHPQLGASPLETSATGASPSPAPHDSADRAPAADASNSDDTEEEARLRRDMLEYARGLDEVGAIVAEIDLEEDASDVSYDENDDAFEFDSDPGDDDDLDEDESEDESGKSTDRLHVPRGYRKRMEELQEKLGLANVGPGATAAERPRDRMPGKRMPAAEAARHAALARYEAATKSNLKSEAVPSTVERPKTPKVQAGKKKVAFSSELDIAPNPVPPTASRPMPTPTPATSTTSITPPTPPTPRPGAAMNSPITDVVVEHDHNVDQRLGTTVAPGPSARKPSRFKAARQAQPPSSTFAPPMTSTTESKVVAEAPSAPSIRSTKIMATALVERPSPRVSKAPDLNDFSEEDHQRQIAMEYEQHRMKRSHSHDQGSLDNVMDNDPRRGPLVDERGQKISRFKAARLNG